MLKASESHELYRLLVENVNDAIVVVCEGMIRYINPKAIQMTGYTREQFMSAPFLDFIYPDDRLRIAKRHGQRIRGKNYHQEFRAESSTKMANPCGRS
jgi:PAS domain S-box-containing protein